MPTIPALNVRPALGATLLSIGLLTGLFAQPLGAQPDGMPGFEPTGDFILELGGVELSSAEIYKSERAGAYLMISPELELPLLLNLRSRALERVNLMKVMKKDDGTVDLLTNPVLGRIGAFQLMDGEVHFEIDGQPARLKQRPWLLELRVGGELRAHNVEYRRQAERYTPNAGHLAALRSVERDVRARVYFGSWCPACSRVVPHVLRVDEELEGSRIRFEYYGLPRPMDDDPETGRAGIRSVPTLVLFEGNRELGRLTGNDLMAPEASLRRLLGAS